MLLATTQKGIRHVIRPVERLYRTRQTNMRFPTLGTKFYTDTLFASEKSMMGFTCAQLFTDGRGYNKFYPMKKKSDAGHSLWSFFSEVGIPQTLVTDGAKEETQGKFKQVVDDSLVQLRHTEPMSPWQNRAESKIGWTKN